MEPGRGGWLGRRQPPPQGEGEALLCFYLLPGVSRIVRGWAESTPKEVLWAAQPGDSLSWDLTP